MMRDEEKKEEQRGPRKNRKPKEYMAEIAMLYRKEKLGLEK